MSQTRVIAVVLVTVLVVLLLLYANGSMGRFLCRHHKDGWLEKHGFITCVRAP
jgi:hypothetical protein